MIFLVNISSYISGCIRVTVMTAMTGGLNSKITDKQTFLIYV